MAHAYNYACVECIQYALCFVICANCWNALTPRTRDVVYVQAPYKTVGESQVVVVSSQLPVLAVSPHTLVRE